MHPLLPFTRRLIGRGLPTILLGLASFTLLSGFIFEEEEADVPAASPAAAVEEVDEAMILAGLAVFKEAGCRGCHGWAATGEREGPNPQGPSLRTTELPMDAIRLTIACGRPGTEMPYFWNGAYRFSSTECYGLTQTQMGESLPPRAAVRFTDAEIDSLTYYIEYYLKDREGITSEECELYFGEGDERCASYPASAE